MKGRLVIGTRGSRLAMIQAQTVAVLLRQAWPEIEIEIRKIVTEGDRNRSLEISEAGDIGVFVKAIEEELSSRSIDIGVHSLKDMPTKHAEGMCIAAVTQRLDPRDVIVANAPLASLKTGARIGTGSLRRTCQLKHLRPDLEVVAIRGNVDTRLGKVGSGELDGVILAAAALLRLGWDDKITEYLPVESFIPAAGQGALALEIRDNDVRVAEAVAVLEHDITREEVTVERDFLRVLEAGCRAPVAALAVADGDSISIAGMVAGADGRELMKDMLRTSGPGRQEAGLMLAKKMLDAGAGELIKEMRRR